MELHQEHREVSAHFVVLSVALVNQPISHTAPLAQLILISFLVNAFQAAQQATIKTQVF